MKRFALLRQTAADPRLALMLALGFSSGLPILLIFSTQSAWLRRVGISKAEIGLMSYCALAYSFKFVWAPFIDSRDPPGLRRLGRRRGWMLITQAGVAAGLVGLSFATPERGLAWNIAFAAFTAFAAASQDVTIDGWRIDAAPRERQGLMFSAYNLGYRLGMISAGAGALFLADAYGWRGAYLAMAALMAVGVAACLMSPRFDTSDPAGAALANADLTRALDGFVGGLRRVPGVGDRLADAFARLASVYGPSLHDLVRRFGLALIPILLLVALYRLPDFVSGVMALPLYVDLGFSNSEIATASKLYGVWVGILGAFAGGFAVGRLGLMPPLLIGGVAASASHLSMAYLAQHAGRFDLLLVAISLENFAGSFAGAALIAYMSSLVASRFAATQYALLSSLYALPGKFVGGLSGFAVERYGYAPFFTSTALIGVPVALLCVVVWRIGRTPRPAAAPPLQDAEPSNTA